MCALFIVTVEHGQPMGLRLGNEHRVWSLAIMKFMIKSIAL